MTGLTVGRVIVLDDDEKDALAILKALGQKGIASIYFDGKTRTLPKRSERLSGVRLAVLDMDLIGGGTADKAKAATLVRRLDGILSPENGPYVVLAWTNHIELVEHFESYVFASENTPRPIATAMIPKAQCKDAGSGEFDTRLIIAQLAEKLKGCPPLAFLQEWEQTAFRAATDVTNALSSLGADVTFHDLDAWRSAWKAELAQIMAVMAEEETGGRPHEEAVAPPLFRALNPLHSDRMEARSTEAGSAVGLADLDVDAGGHFALEKKARINTMLHLAVTGSDAVSAGSIYHFSMARGPGWLPKTSGLLDHLLQNPDQDDARNDITAAAMRIAVEITPPCDHSQRNLNVARFVCGLVVPNSKQKRIKKGDFIKRLGPFYLSKRVRKPGTHWLYLSGRHFVTADLADVSTLRTVGRLRHEAHTDVQVWFAQHASRPGMFLLHP